MADQHRQIPAQTPARYIPVIKKQFAPNIPHKPPEETEITIEFLDSPDQNETGFVFDSSAFWRNFIWFAIGAVLVFAFKYTDSTGVIATMAAMWPAGFVVGVWVGKNWELAAYKVKQFFNKFSKR